MEKELNNGVPFGTGTVLRLPEQEAGGEGGGEGTRRGMDNAVDEGRSNTNGNEKKKKKNRKKKKRKNNANDDGGSIAGVVVGVSIPIILFCVIFLIINFAADLRYNANNRESDARQRRTNDATPEPGWCKHGKVKVEGAAREVKLLL